MTLVRIEMMLEGSYDINDPESMAQAREEAKDNILDADLEIVNKNEIKEPTLKFSHGNNEFSSLYVLGENDYHEDKSSRKVTTFYGPGLVLIEESPDGRTISDEDLNSPRIWKWIQRIGGEGIRAIKEQTPSRKV